MKNILLLTCLLLLPVLTNAQVTKYKAVFTINFIRYVGWPEEAKQGDFTIGVLRNSKMADQMRKHSDGKKFGFQDVKVVEFNSPAEIDDCQVIYVPSSVDFAKHAEMIKKKVNQKNTLIVTESEGATENGAMINFVIRDDKLKFEIHKSNAAAFGVPISIKLEGMAAAISL